MANPGFDKNGNVSAVATLPEFRQNYDSFVVCPFDKSHRMLASRLSIHLIRCSRDHAGKKMVRCPFNTTHVIKSSDMQAHVASCYNRKDIEYFINPDALPPVEPKAATQELLTTQENWDNEPEVKSYNPQAYCEHNRVIRQLNGAKPSERRIFREEQRKKMQNQ